MTGFWIRVADLVVTHPLMILAVCLAGLLAAGRHRGPDQVKLQPACRP